MRIWFCLLSAFISWNFAARFSDLSFLVACENRRQTSESVSCMLSHV